MFVWLLHFKGFFLYALLFYMKNVGCGPLFTSVHPNIYFRTFYLCCGLPAGFERQLVFIAVGQRRTVGACHKLLAVLCDAPPLPA